MTEELCTGDILAESLHLTLTLVAGHQGQADQVKVPRGALRDDCDTPGDLGIQQEKT